MFSCFRIYKRKSFSERSSKFFNQKIDINLLSEIATEIRNYLLTLVNFQISFGKTESKMTKLSEKLSISVVWSVVISEFQHLSCNFSDD